MMEAVRTSETSVYSETTCYYIPEDSDLQQVDVLLLSALITDILLVIMNCHFQILQEI
jgi:hypothetical protein